MTIAQFDRDISLAELLRGIPNGKLTEALNKSLACDWCLLDASSMQLLCSTNQNSDHTGWCETAIRVELESIGTLEANTTQSQLQMGVAWLEMVLASAHRYSMAADLHLETVYISFTELQREHAALQESERRYRELSEQLEQRVSAQIVLIERSQRQLYQAEKMASVGSLAAGVAHEINNPIGFIRSNLSSAITNVAKMSEVLQAFQADNAFLATELWNKYDIGFILEDFSALLAESVDGADRVARIVSNLKDYSNVDNAEVSLVDLNETILTVMRLIGDQPHGEVALSTEVQHLPRILCDRGRVNQVLLSLVQNALVALRGQGAIHVASCVRDQEIRIAVRDNGCGIDAKTLARIFDPFFTMQDVGKGTGLGLTVSQEIISSYGGHIEVESEVGVGSTFTVCLPVPSTS